MVSITFEQRAVAFVDVLGFRSIVSKAGNDANAMMSLQCLIDLLSSAVPTLDKTVDPAVPVRLIPLHNYISDSIILSAPVADNTVRSYNGVEIVAMRIIQLTHYFLNEGYLIRGGLTVGQVWHTDTNIVGPAYQEAYLLEQNNDNPCVALSQTAEGTLRTGSRMFIRRARGKRGFCTKKSEPLIVNGLHNFYIPNSDEQGGIERRYKKYSELADRNLRSNLPKSARSKWRWFRKYLEAESSAADQWAGV